MRQSFVHAGGRPRCQATPDLAKAVNLGLGGTGTGLHSHAFAGSERSCSLFAIPGGTCARRRPARSQGADHRDELFGRDASYDTGKTPLFGSRPVASASVCWPIMPAGCRARPGGTADPPAPRQLYARVPRTAVPAGSDFSRRATVDAALTSASAAPVGWPRWPAPAWAAIGVLVLACVLLVWHNRQLSGRVPPAPGMELVPWSHFGPRMSIRVVLTDINYAIYSHIVARRLLSLEEYLGDQWTGDFDSRMAATSPRSGNQYTSVVSAVAASRVSAMLMTTGRSAYWFTRGRCTWTTSKASKR